MTGHQDRPNPDAHVQAANAPARARTAGRPRSSAVSSRQIATAVVDLISERGLLGWSIRDLANRMGLSTGTISYYFRDKRALLVEALDAGYALPADLDEFRAHPPTAQLQQMVEFFVLDSERRRRGWRFFMEYMVGAGHDEILRARHDERYERQHRFFTRLIDAGIQAGQITTDLGAEREAEHLIALGNGLALQQLVTPACLPPAAAREILVAHLRHLQDGVDRLPDED